jgi:hypothetical protein
MEGSAHLTAPILSAVKVTRLREYAIICEMNEMRHRCTNSTGLRRGQLVRLIDSYYHNSESKLLFH